MKAVDWANRHLEEITLSLAFAFGISAVIAQIMYRTFVLAMILGAVVLLMMWTFSDADTPSGGESESSSAELEADEAAGQGVVHSP